MYNEVIVIVLLSMENYHACHTLGSAHKAFILFHCRCADGLMSPDKIGERMKMQIRVVSLGAQGTMQAH